jgi:flagellar biosynthesis/type III secretory pathway M-ring protein FliF/YscJ
MTGDNSELAMAGLVLAILILIFAVVWFVFMLPMEKGLHRRRMELVQRKLLQNEQRLLREANEKAGEERDSERDDRNGRRDPSRKQASGG